MQHCALGHTGDFGTAEECRAALRHNHAHHEQHMAPLLAPTGFTCSQQGLHHVTQSQRAANLCCVV